MAFLNKFNKKFKRRISNKRYFFVSFQSSINQQCYIIQLPSWLNSVCPAYPNSWRKFGFKVRLLNGVTKLSQSFTHSKMLVVTLGINMKWLLFLSLKVSVLTVIFIFIIWQSLHCSVNKVPCSLINFIWNLKNCTKLFN